MRFTLGDLAHFLTPMGRGRRKPPSARGASAAGPYQAVAPALSSGPFDTLSPDLRSEVNNTYEQIQADVDEAVKKTREELRGYSNPLDQAGFYQTRIATIERESADRLYKEIIKILDEKKMLIKRRDLLTTQL